VFICRIASYLQRPAHALAAAIAAQSFYTPQKAIKTGQLIKFPVQDCRHAGGTSDGAEDQNRLKY
jgi:hypothetical protein